MSDEILFSQIDGTNGQVGLITLNRPQALNALSLNMNQLLQQQLEEWDRAPNIKAIIIQSEHQRAFCAGGDIRYLYEVGRSKPEKAAEFTFHEYRLNHTIANLKTPYIALMNGITMGGGVGISLHGSHPIATEKTVFAMPETLIGFFPDIGSSYLLQKCPPAIANYLTLTGARLSGSQLVNLGLAHSYLHEKNISKLIDTIIETDLSTRSIDDILTDQQSPLDEPVELLELANVEQFFGAQDVVQIMSSLATSPLNWAKQTLEKLQQVSPTSLLITAELTQRAQGLNLASCLNMEYTLSAHIFHSHDFYEGTRALLVDKDNQPQWQPAGVASCSRAMIVEFFHCDREDHNPLRL